jgi:two-component system OmpR family sensor kinase
VTVRRHPGADSVLVRRAAVRLGLQAAVGTALVVALLAGVTIVVLVRSQHTDSDTLLADTVTRADDVQDPPSGVWLVIRSASGVQQHTPGLPAGLPVDAALDRVVAGGAPELADVTVNGRDFRVRTELRSIPDGGRAAVQAALDLRAPQTQLASLLRALLIGGVVGLALAAAAGSWLGRRAVRPLEAALGLQRRFVADASHELRTPLTLLSTRAQMLRRRLRGTTDASTLRADVDGVVADAQRLAAILDDLLLAADPRTSTTNTPVDLTAMAHEVVAAAAPAAAAADVTISVDDRAGQAHVAGSAPGLRRALTALVDNAVRHAAGAVELRVTATTKTVALDVVDDGPGIDEEMLPHLFERFASTGPDHGVGPRRYGIGLALVSDIIDRHDGTIYATNTFPGAVFRLELPRTRPSRRLQGISQDRPSS